MAYRRVMVGDQEVKIPDFNLKIGIFRANSIVWSIKGFPTKGKIFFSGKPFEPPRAKIKAWVIIIN